MADELEPEMFNSVVFQPRMFTDPVTGIRGPFVVAVVKENDWDEDDFPTWDEAMQAGGRWVAQKDLSPNDFAKMYIACISVTGMTGLGEAFRAAAGLPASSGCTCEHCGEFFNQPGGHNGEFDYCPGCIPGQIERGQAMVICPKCSFGIHRPAPEVCPNCRAATGVMG